MDRKFNTKALGSAAANTAAKNPVITALLFEAQRRLELVQQLCDDPDAKAEDVVRAVRAAVMDNSWERKCRIPL